MDTLTNFRLADFSLAVPQGRHETSGHVCLTHGAQYTLLLGNHTDRRCDAQVTIDGQVVGCWRIQAGGTIELERPTHDTGRFTFYRLGTPEAVPARVIVLA